VLEHGAASLVLTMRRHELLAVNPFRWMEKAGYLRHYASMDDAARWRWMTTTFDFGQPPTQDGLNRCAQFPNFRLHAGATWTGARRTAQGIELALSDGTRQMADHLLVGTGFEVDPVLRPELRGLADHVVLWRDRYHPPPGQEHAVCGSYPYLAADLSFVERIAGACPALADIHCFNYAASVSNGFSGASLSGMKYGIEPLLWGITRRFWLADEQSHYQVLASWDTPDTDVSVIAAHRAA
jgi:cation diffusion facilitator CzcD-associated flavoprotein CzcO